MSEKFVKVRGRHGTKSLDLTIPAELSAEHDIKPGDLFKVEIITDDDSVTIKYQLIYKNKH
ncbi:AbrB/MazE/SpoVT family DNA-binding domain-containing protein [Methanobrevibacter smithii]|uniref:AbrB/MazE/SpoVT family DNA-binding domain-containing protein n=1 Tax=Methanobrevibacter smithii TaxID=2173 RepID=UPI002E794950|nr:AbrB/MazE/SpoVT family DNA-binding domain-containing protein [Methanobrevibacter smithii]MEE0720842.1 AbrB/MazE/SpoVT family DNA-binding domain-containing protein [Methanobrevibacter smithii]